jgi:tetratricopeptide (TPR) repeat protein
LLASGQVHEETSQYLKALEDYRRVQEIDPRNVDAQLGLGSVYESLRAPQEAVNAYRKAEEVDPEYYRPYHLLGSFYFSEGHYLEAIEQFHKMIEAAPGLPDSYSALAAPLIELGRYGEAEQTVQRSLAIRETAMALNNLAVIRYFQKRYADAAACQKRALAYEPDNFVWWMNAGDFVRWAGHPGEARQYYRNARNKAELSITINPQLARVRAYFAYACARLGEKSRSHEEIGQALSLLPGDDSVQELALRIDELLGERDRALDALRHLTPDRAKQLTHQPDLADFFQDDRVKQEMIRKGER